MKVDLDKLERLLAEGPNVELMCAIRNALPTLIAELRAARETNGRLNRRCQTYEAGLAEKLSETQPRGFGRMLAISGLTMREAELDAIHDRLVTIVDEAFGLQPVIESTDELLTALERLLNEDRMRHVAALDERDKLREQVERGVEVARNRRERPE